MRHRHTARYTLRSTRCIPHLTYYTHYAHNTPRTTHYPPPHVIHCALHATLYTHSTHHILHTTPYTLHITHTIHATLYTPRTTRHTVNTFTPHIRHYTIPTLLAREIIDSESFLVHSGIVVWVVYRRPKVKS